MKRVQHRKSATWKVYIENDKTWKDCITEKVPHNQGIAREWNFENIIHAQESTNG